MKKSKLRRAKLRAKKKERKAKRTSLLVALALCGDYPRMMERFKSMDLQQLRNWLAYFGRGGGKNTAEELLNEYFPSHDTP